MVSMPLTINIYIYQLMSNVQLRVSKTFYSHTLIHTCTQNNYVSLTKEIQKRLSKVDRKDIFIDKGK